MKNSKRIGVVLLILAVIVSLINITPNVIANSYENYIADKTVTALRPGDEVFFDNSGTNWDNVYIYMWDGTKTDGWYKEWNSADAMTKIDGTNIYKFVVPEDTTFTENNYENIIFKNGKNGNENQTINLGFIESGFSYIVTGKYTEDYQGSDYAKDRQIGYWYLYDKAPIVEHLNLLKQYQQNKAKYTDESYSNLDDLITQAEIELKNEMKLYAYQDEYGNDKNLYYIKIATTLKAIDDIIDNLKIFEGNINIQTDGNGTAVTNQTDDSKVPVGTYVTVTASPNQYYEIDQITVTDENGNNVSVDSNNTFTMPKSNVTVNATFKKIQKSITTISENGSVTTNQTDDSRVNAGETVKLTLTPNQWCELESLTVTDEEGNNIPVTNNTFTMPTSNVTVNAKFKEINKIHDIIINTTENGSVVTDVGPENVTVETPVKITTTPNYGYELDTLTVKDAEGNIIPVTNNTFTMPNTNVEITATFKHIKKSITLNNPEGGTVRTNQADNSKVNVGETVKLTLTPNVNYELDTVKVTDAEGNDVPVTNNTFTMPNSNVKVEASYRRITKSITISNSNNGKTTVNVEDLKKVNAGETVKITTIPNDGCEVEEIIVIDEEGNKIALTSDNTFVMPVKNVIITTIFKNNNINNTGDNNNIVNNTNNTDNNEDASDTNKDNVEQDNDAINANSTSKKVGNNISNDTKNVADVPKTGDAIIIVAAILVIAVIVFIVLSKKSKKQKILKNK